MTDTFRTHSGEGVGGPEATRQQRLTDARDAVRAAYGVDLDESPAALALLDGLLRSFVDDLPKDQRDALLEAIGFYFGEVVRKVLQGFWVPCGSDPARWRIGLTSCFLHFSPVGMTGECLTGCESAQYDGTFTISSDDTQALAARLDQAPEVTEEEYYSLCGRLDVLTLVADWLVARQLAASGVTVALSEEDYVTALAPNPGA